MLEFRCWYCNRRFNVDEKKIGEVMRCSCKNPLRVPSRKNGNSQIKTVADRVVEAVVYGGGGGLLGCGLAVLILSQLRVREEVSSWILVGGLTLFGFLMGALVGEPFITWIGKQIREREGK